ncbi:hypothetical protein CEUSTIGMA_g12043.t1 [Chlamydomonas eustigma]|uniref:Reverse transcriptase Ty1/copia-type domain-containing protein n=1 Tax=Chlamydomonas eustigma TaxID=1157962 RepID=A0A250XNX8_9CHLO|nr:hypothetical protein CEUSTIGMA_g12043.t1 [Chlamydomonas eustigma]|eukprot:GAX84622.1 hypothetical protein CEUSTIGMA_g12043.t1 [Chlamydomonas eustigma]
MAGSASDYVNPNPVKISFNLLYQALVTFPTEVFAIATTSVVDMDALTCVMRYVESTQHFGLEFGGVKDPCLVGYADSSYSSDPDTRRSTTGYVFLYDGGAVSWGSRLQQTVAMSTMEAEYMVVAAAAKEGLWFRKLMEELQMQQGQVHIWGDNQCALNVF